MNPENKWHDEIEAAKEVTSYAFSLYLASVFGKVLGWVIVAAFVSCAIQGISKADLYDDLDRAESALVELSAFSDWLQGLQPFGATYEINVLCVTSTTLETAAVYAGCLERYQDLLAHVSKLAGGLSVRADSGDVELLYDAVDCLDLAAGLKRSDGLRYDLGYLVYCWEKI